jgi:hypothetical protein
MGQCHTIYKLVYVYGMRNDNNEVSAIKDDKRRTEVRMRCINVSIYEHLVGDVVGARLVFVILNFDLREIC